MAKLILFLRQGRKQKLSQQNLADLIEVAGRKTIHDWEKGATPSIENQEKIAAYLGKSLTELRVYLSGELTLEAFMRDVADVPRSQQFKQILEWLPSLKAGEIMEVAQRCFELLQRHFYPTEAKETTKANPMIAELLQSLDLEKTEEQARLSRDRLQAIMDGDRPSNCELVLLAKVLPRPNGGAWTTQELMELRDQTFPQNNKQKDEQTNGIK